MRQRRMIGRAGTVLVLLLAAAVGFGTEGGVGGPLPELTEDQMRLFGDGKETFEEIATPPRLGPFFNGFSCAECHGHPAVGGVAPPDRAELREMRIGRLDRWGQFDPMLEFGGPVFHRLGLGDLPESELQQLPPACRRVKGSTTPPDEARFVSFRIATPVFGGGLIEAIPAEEILRRADPDDVKRRDGISGRPNLLGIDVGRFGWKAQVSNLPAFAADAYRVEMGITSPLAPTETHIFRQGPMGHAARQCAAASKPFEDDGADSTKFADFMRFLAPPPRGPITAEVRRGEQLFHRAGCHKCHVPELRTGPNVIAALDRKPVQAFSDFLLHDIGTGDGIVQGGASGNEFRTAPLWGVRFREHALLHDGRATTMLDALFHHNGEAARAKDRVFHQFSARERESLLAFLRSL